jgi:hypothetical protein
MTSNIAISTLYTLYWLRTNPLTLLLYALFLKCSNVFIMFKYMKLCHCACMRILYMIWHGTFTNHKDITKFYHYANYDRFYTTPVEGASVCVWSVIVRSCQMSVWKDWKVCAKPCLGKMACTVLRQYVVYSSSWCTWNTSSRSLSVQTKFFASLYTFFLQPGTVTNRFTEYS